MTKTILITGGAGFIGSHLTDRLLSEGNNVIVVDNFFTGRKENLSDHKENKNLEVIRHDITLPIYLECDEVYHLACPASPVHYQHNPVKTIKTNVLGTINMLGLAKRVGAKFLLASTSEVYGDPLEHPQKETYWGNVNPIGPRSCYDEGKRVAESLTVNYQDRIDAKIVRIFNTYGPRMLFDDGRVVSNFIHRALTNQDLQIDGDGSQTRSFCYVSDLVDGIIRTMNADNFQGPVNLGNPDEMTIKELAEKVIKLTNSDSNIIYSNNFRTDDPMKRKPDTTVASKNLNWTAEIPVDQGLKNIIQDFKERLNV